jgi:hypothetical protein
MYAKENMKVMDTIVLEYLPCSLRYSIGTIVQQILFLSTLREKTTITGSTSFSFRTTGQPILLDVDTTKSCLVNLQSSNGIKRLPTMNTVFCFVFVVAITVILITVVAIVSIIAISYTFRW